MMNSPRFKSEVLQPYVCHDQYELPFLRSERPGANLPSGTGMISLGITL